MKTLFRTRRKLLTLIEDILNEPDSSLADFLIVVSPAEQQVPGVAPEGTDDAPIPASVLAFLNAIMGPPQTSALPPASGGGDVVGKDSGGASARHRAKVSRDG